MSSSLLLRNLVFIPTFASYQLICYFLPCNGIYIKKHRHMHKKAIYIEEYIYEGTYIWKNLNMEKFTFGTEYKWRAIKMKDIYSWFYKKLSIHKMKFTQGQKSVYNNEHLFTKILILLLYIQSSLLVNNLTCYT